MQTYNQVKSEYRTISEALKRVGGMNEQATIEGNPLSPSDQAFIANVQIKAVDFPFTFNLMEALKEEGAMAVRRHMPA